MPQLDLVYDVGIHIGNDTDYYLGRGYRVVAVDADPRMIDRCRQRFAQQIAEGRLTLLNLGIAEKQATLPFWVNTDNDEWSSFDVGLGKRNGTTAYEIRVPCVTFDSILREYGVPYYLKIDIEGSDLLCVQALDRIDLPVYVSTEIYATDQICYLRDLGYSRFKLVNQRAHGGYCSGPFGDEAIGPWHTLDDVCYEWLHLHTGHRERCEFSDSDPNNWFDLHAAI